MSASKIVLWVILGAILIIPITCFFSTCNMAAKMTQNANDVVYKEFSPSALLDKYKWFKDASAQLDAKIANMSDYRQRYQSMKEGYGADSLHRSKWNRSDLDQWNTWQSEESGVKASYNDLCAQYNSAMSKFNYRFCNVGQLPQGATVVLPKDYKPYQ